MERGVQKRGKIAVPGEPPAGISIMELDYGMEQGLSNKWDGTPRWCRSCRFADSTKLGLD